MYDYIAVALILSIVGLIAVRSLYRTLTGSSKSGCGCSGAASCSSRVSCGMNAPLVTIKTSEGRK